ncbi:MAG: hypothetical protein JXA93_08405 [Anaerolineae bacterium]|nr:hypothetical protein [Anaerolineae bacterium]
MRKSRFISTQSRLNVAFTLLFVLGVIILTSFIKTSIDAMGYNAEARDTYTQARRFYQAKAYLQNLEKAFNRYELTSDYDALSEYQSSYARLQQSLSNMAAETELPEERAALNALAQDITALRQQFDVVIQAVDEEDWDAVFRLDDQAYALVDPIVEQIDGLALARSDALFDLYDEVSTFADLAWLATIVAVPIFLVVALFVAVTVARQIHIPLRRMTDGLETIRQERFDEAAMALLAERRDEIGYLAREYLEMARAVLRRQATLDQERAAIRAKIR